MLYVFVEGYYDDLFVDKVFVKGNPNISIIRYATREDCYVKAYIKSISCMPNASYVFIADSDGLTIKEKKKKLIEHYPNLDENAVFLSVYEVESWYYAGISETFSIKNKFRHYQLDTNTLTKEQFYMKLPANSSRILTMLNILDNYNTDIACNRNYSFQLIYTKNCFG